MQGKRVVFLIVTVIFFSIRLGSAEAANGYPFFASLKVSKANIRTGPGKRYPIKWTYVKKHLPLEVYDRFDNWYHVTDEFGEEGWIHSNLVSHNRYFVVANYEAILYRNPGDYYLPQYKLEKNVRGKILSCRHIWCQVNIDGIEGWLYKSNIWGVYKNEEF